MTNSPQAAPARIPGYDGGPFQYQPEVLDEHLFWLGHLRNYYSESEEAEELVGGTDEEEAGALQSRLLGGDTWPVFTVPLAGDHRLYVVYRAFEENEGIDYLLHHPDWDETEQLAQDDGHFMGPGLSWAELTAAADNRLPGGSTTDAHARLLLLLPAFSDDAVPDGAVERLTAALRAYTRLESPERLAAALLEDQGPCGPVHWTKAEGGYPINDGEYSFRNPANRFAWPAARLARVATALAPPTARSMNEE
ncbi:hypothetical protein [Streptomyces sp. MA15]|uniref:hypothetical protein n=1 Tax=Streptomyces sp. MA15 TaxID=3055061 RepID=UPI0025AF8EF3|nr:hypothetical protein [Streptomyces sp. MA15]MDN3272490.1 hypothetical protein [Streptomyces sp. MA15]